MFDPLSNEEAEVADKAAEDAAFEDYKASYEVLITGDEIKEAERSALQTMRDNGTAETMPAADRYDYGRAAAAGYSPEPDEAGNVYLPNEFHAPGAMVSSGRDMATTEKVMESVGDEAFEQDRRERKAVARREMDFIDWSVGVLQGEVETEGAMAVVQQTSRIVVGSVLSLANSINTLTEMALGGQIDLPDAPRLKNMGPYEGMASVLGEFLMTYGMTSGAMPLKAKRAMTGTNYELTKDMIATFVMDPSEGNLATLLNQFGVITDEDLVAYLDSTKIQSPLGQRVASMGTDALAAGAAAAMITKVAADLVPALKGATEDVMENVRLQGELLVDRGIQKQREGLTTLNAGVPVKAAAGMAEEAVGKALKGTAGLAQRMQDEAVGLVADAAGEMGKGVSKTAWVDSKVTAGVGADAASEAWDIAASQKEKVVQDRTGTAKKRVKARGIAYGNKRAISTRFPKGPKATENPLKEDLQVGLESSMTDPEALKHNIGLMSQYENFPTTGGLPSQAKAERIIEHVKENLLALHDMVPEDTRARSKLWYVGANRIAHKAAQTYGIKPEAAAGVYAALSPQKDWFMNVSLGHRVMDIMLNKADEPWTPEMGVKVEQLRSKVKNEAHKYAVDSIQGKTLSELEHPVEKALWLRVYDETYHDRGHPIVTPEGDYMGMAMTKGGKEKKTGWGSLNEISNAVSVILDQSLENISTRMGEQHKVRSFYNNIINPNSPKGEVTIDTHAVAAALFQPFAGKDEAVKHNFGSKPGPKDDDYIPGKPGPKNSTITGNKGTYGIYAEAYRRAAAERGLLPREMQSITWEAVRGLFDETQKTKPNKKAAKAIWLKFKDGKITQEEARQQILKHFGGIDEPDWK